MSNALITKSGASLTTATRQPNVINKIDVPGSGNTINGFVDMSKKKPVIKIGAEIPFTRYFYEYQQPASSKELESRFMELESSVSERIKRLFSEVN